MAIAFDAFTNAGTGTTALSTTGSDRLLVVGVFTNSADGTFTGITYNGVSLTQDLSQAVNAGTQQVHIWHLVNPASGANNLITSGTDAGAAVFVTSFTGVKQSSQPDATATGTASAATSVSTTLTTIANNSLVVAMVRGDGGDTKSNNSGVAGTNRDGGQSFYWDSNGGVTPAGGKTVSYSAAGSQGWGLATVSFSPVTPPDPEVSDSVSISENITVTVSGPLPLISDSISISESVSISIEGPFGDLDINISDGMTISESINLNKQAMVNDQLKSKGMRVHPF